jgi:hypothetical protein
MEMNAVIDALSAVTLSVLFLLCLANLISIAGYLTRHRGFVERFQRSILTATSLLRLGVR